MRGGGKAGEFAIEEGARVVVARPGGRGGEFDFQQEIEQEFDGAQIAGGRFLDERQDDRVAPRQIPAPPAGHPCVERGFEQRDEPPIAARSQAAACGVPGLAFPDTAVQRRLLAAGAAIRRVVVHQTTAVDIAMPDTHLSGDVMNLIIALST